MAATQMLRFFGRIVVGRAAATTTTRIANYRTALIPAILIQEGSFRTMALSSTSSPSSSSSSSAAPSISPPSPSPSVAAMKADMLTKSLELRPAARSNVPSRSLAILFGWMLAKTRHLLKYDSFYKKQGFDVLIVRLTPWQLLWPTKGTQMVALDVLNFLNHRSYYESILIHGFSVGAYQYGEVLVRMLDNRQTYSHIEKRIIGQIFDSAVDYYGIPNGLAKAVTSNKLLQTTLQAYISYHMRTFYDSATKHYLKSSDIFHNNFIHAPSLFFFSKDDPVATPEGNMVVIRKWEASGIPVFAKCWDSSPHVSHYHFHTEEYLQELSEFLKRLGCLTEPHRTVSKL